MIIFYFICIFWSPYFALFAVRNIRFIIIIIDQTTNLVQQQKISFVCSSSYNNIWPINIWVIHSHCTGSWRHKTKISDQSKTKKKFVCLFCSFRYQRFVCMHIGSHFVIFFLYFSNFSACHTVSLSMRKKQTEKLNEIPKPNKMGCSQAKPRYLIEYTPIFTDTDT